MPRMDKKPILDKMPRMGGTVTKAKKANLPRINKMAIVAKMARVANGQKTRVAKMARVANGQRTRVARMPSG